MKKSTFHPLKDLHSRPNIRPPFTFQPLCFAIFSILLWAMPAQAITLVSEDFTSSAGSFTPVNGGSWNASGGRYVLSSPSSGVTPGVLENISVHGTSISGDFTLSAVINITGTGSDWNDAAIVFCYQNEDNYYYVSLNESNDSNTKGIIKVAGGTPTELADISISVASGTDYPIVIERSGSSIVAKVNGAQVASTSDSTFTSGKVGFATYNDGAQFDDLLVTTDDITAPSVPTGLVASNITNTTVDLNWNASTDNVEVTGYKVYTGGANPVSVAGTSTTLTGLSADTSYVFTVSAYDAASNESSQSSGVNVTTDPASEDPLAANIVAYWGFNSINSGSTPDDSGNGHTGTVTGGVSAVSGQIDNALSFDGSNGKVAVGNMDVTASSGNDGITLAAWINPDQWTTASRDNRIISKATGTQDQDHYWMLSGIASGSDTYLRMRLKAGGSTTTLIASSGNLATSTWTHVAGTYDGSTIRLFVNGSQVGSTSKSGTINTSSSVGVTIGINPDNNRPFDGKLDEVYIFDRALSASEISDLMTRDPSAVDTEAPSVPTGLASSNLTTTSVDLDWNASTDNVAVTGYNLYTNGANPASVAGTSVTVIGLSPGTGYDFSVSAFDAADNESSQSSAVSVTTIQETVAAPAFSPAAGAYIGAQSVTITSATSGATIRFTTDGSTPTSGSGMIYSGPVNIALDTTLKAIAYKSGMLDSAVTTGGYMITLPQVAAPEFSPVAGTYTSTQSVTITSATGGATIRYTTDGSTPSATSGTIYSGAISMESTTTLKAIAYKTGMQDSFVITGVYTINLPQVAAPQFSPGGGSYTSAQSVSITSATSGATIRYTTDGSTPSSTAGTVYSSAISLSANTTLKAIAYKSGMADSSVSSATYTITISQPETYQITGHVDDRDIRDDSSMGWIGEQGVRVGGANTTQDNSMVYIFELPEFGEGETVTDASLSFNLEGVANNPSFHVDLYGLDYQSTTTLSGSMYYEGSYDGDSNATALQDDILVNSTSTGTVTTSSTGSSNLVSYLTAQITAGAEGGDYVLLRLNQDTADASSYHYYHVSSANHATSGYRPVLTIETNGGGSGDTEAPTVPTGVATSNPTTSSIDVSWSASSDNVAVTGYKVYIDGSNPVTVSSTSTTITGLSDNTTYAFTVSAFDAAGNESSQSSGANGATSSAPDTQSPTIPTGVATGNPTTSSIDVSWSASSDNVGVTGYKVYTNGSNPVSVTSGTSTTISSLSAGTTYSFTVSAYDAASNESGQSSAINGTTTASSGGVTIDYTDGFYNQDLGASYSSTLTAEFDAVPSASPMDAVVSLSLDDINGYSDMATIVRFNPSGQIDARNGGTYAAASSIPYSAGVSYHFRLAIDVAAHTYSIYVTPSGSSEILVGDAFDFRSDQASISALDTWNAYVSSVGESVTVSNFSVDSQLAAPSITTHPQNATAGESQTVQFTVIATGNPNPTYQWRKDGTNISGAIASTLTLTDVQSADAGDYDVVVTNSQGSVTSNDATLTVLGLVEAPAFSPTPGNYASSQNVSITTGTSGATIRYTTDGSAPSATSGTVYSSAISISSSTTLRAVAYKSGMQDSDVVSGFYSIGGTVLAPPQHVVDTGNNAPLIRYNRYLSGGAHTDGAWNGGWQVTHALAVAAGNTSAEAKMLEQIQFSLQGDNCISANGGYPAQHERHITGAYTILKDTSFWNSTLTSTERNKITLLMKAALIASAYTTADATYTGSVTALDGDTNLHRTWNPNYREGMFGGMIHATVFFGGTAAVNNILNTYDHDAFVAELVAAGLTNTHETFTWAQNHAGSGAPSGSQIESNIANYRYNGQPLKEPMGQLYDLTVNTYSKNVNCGLNGGAGINWNGTATGIIHAGCGSLPNSGQLGMLLEFDSSDANGARSAAWYAYDGLRPNLTNHVVVLQGGYWQAGSQADTIVGRLDIGITDMEYKLQQGYRGYAKGVGYPTPFTINEPHWSWSFQTTLPLWFETVAEYHGVGSGTPTVAAPAFSPAGGTYGSSRSVTITSATSGATIRYTTDGSTPTSTSGTVYSGAVSITANTTLKAIAYKSAMNDSTVSTAFYIINTGGGTVINPASGFYNQGLGAGYTSNFSVEFDVVPGSDPIDAVVGLSDGNISGYTGMATIVRFNTSGNIDARNGGTYSAASTIGYTAGQTYHFRLAINVSNHTYSTYVTPSGGSETIVGLDYAFRSEQASVSELDTWNAAVASSPGGSITVDNFTVDAQLTAPSITNHPVSINVGEGQSAEFSVVATGNPSPTYQWRKNGTNIGGATSNPYTLSNVQTSDAGDYDVVVTNSSGNATSNDATLTVLQTVAAPTFSPPGGGYSDPINVTISSTTSGATIRYTTDGTDPTSTTGTVYSGAINLSSVTTLKAIAYKSGMADSAVTSAFYGFGGEDTPIRVPSFGPNGTHWPSLVDTPFMYDNDIPNIIVVDCTWSAIAAAINSVDSSEAAAGVLIKVSPGTLPGNGTNGTPVLQDIGSTSWSKRVTVAPRDGYGTVAWSGGFKMVRVYGICFSGFTADGILLNGCTRTAFAWMKISGYLGGFGIENQTTTQMEFVEIVHPDSALSNGDTSNFFTNKGNISSWLFDGCYAAPHYYLEGVVPYPHVDTLQFASTQGGSYANMHIRDGAYFASNNAAIQTGGINNLLVEHSYVIAGPVSRSRYPFMPGASHNTYDSSFNGSGSNLQAVDSVFIGSMTINNATTPQPWSYVSNTRINYNYTGTGQPLSGSWTVDTTLSASNPTMPPYPTDTYLNSIWQP